MPWRKKRNSESTNGPQPSTTRQWPNVVGAAIATTAMTRPSRNVQITIPSDILSLGSITLTSLFLLRFIPHYRITGSFSRTCYQENAPLLHNLEVVSTGGVASWWTGNMVFTAGERTAKMKAMSNKFYITTPIFYVNDKPPMLRQGYAGQD